MGGAVPAGRPEHRWPAVVAILVALTFWLTLPSFFLFPYTVVAAIACAVLLVPLISLNPGQLTRETPWSRRFEVGLSIVLLLCNQVLLVRLVDELLTAPPTEGRAVLLAAVQLWATNAIVFGIVYWQLDADGPIARLSNGRDPQRADFRFPQDERADAGSWRPRFFDYLYVSITAGLAFSAADAMPLTRRVKALMAVEAIAAYAISVLVIARAVSAIT